ncbi:MAG: hypothetical protein QOJ59_347 [Thermomicrobiales bacterium]|jgi:uncharacterized protein YpuA (DUF1002 family)|nr:hypothetical protein [Thermomicrobiales bacterium]
MRPAPSLARTKGQRIALLLLVALLLATVGGQTGIAAETGKVITLGESLNAEQRREMLDYFKSGDDDVVLTVTQQETVEAMQGVLDGVGGPVTGAYSSTALTCRNLGDGLDITTRNITLITPSMYAMALVTAGLGDATLVVSAPFDTSALGTSAMTGVFKTWEIAPCASGHTTKSRQRLALEQLALAAAIGQAISTGGGTDGVQPAANVVLETQKTIVTEKLKKEADIDAALRREEQSEGIEIPGDLRQKLVDLFVRLGKANIDWSTFAAGWTIEYKANNQISMTGDGIAVREARQTATAEAAAMTATAEAASALTATAEAATQLTATARAHARMTATARAAARGTATASAEAEMTAVADAWATEDAIAALTATADAMPTATALPTPTATPSPLGLSGKVTGIQGNLLSIKEAGKQESTQFTVDSDATITRSGKPATLETVAVGDRVDLTVDGNTNHVRMLSATAAPTPIATRLAGLWWLIPVAAVVAILILWKRRVVVEPFVVKRVAAA